MQGAKDCIELYAKGGNQLLPVGRSTQLETGLLQLFQKLRLLRMISSRRLLPPVSWCTGAAEIGHCRGKFFRH